MAEHDEAPAGKAGAVDSSSNASTADRTVYPYTDASGTLLYEVVRTPPKRFMQRRPDGNGGWLHTLDGVERVPYRLPQVHRAANDGGTVFVVEGEKDADRLM